jgi:microcystin-dependent protein
MPNITIKEILASDKVSELVDKINFNFDQLLLNGGGPLGPIGGQGEIGPIGPRGTLWFTAADIYTTSLSPTWSGTEEQVNDPNVPGYPQYKGDPNKYLSVGLGIFPENTYQLGYSNKQFRTGDLYLQEGNDSLNSTPSYDGDIWQYDVDSSTWFFTGVNIRGNSGGTGSSALTEWVREAIGTEDIIYPKQDPGQDIARVSIGVDPAQAVNESHPTSKLSIIGDGNELLAFLERSLHGGNTSDAATITMTGSGNLLVQGSNIGAQRQIQLQTVGANIFLDNGAGQTYTLDTANARHYFVGGSIRVLSPDTNSTHTFENASGRNIQIKLSTSVSHAIDSNLHLILQKTGGNRVGIGNIAGIPGSLLSVAGNMSIGDGYKTISAPTNGIIVEGLTGLGYSAPVNRLSVAGGLSVNSNQNLNPAVSRTVAEFRGGGAFQTGGVEIQLTSDTNNVIGENNIIKLSSISATIWGRIGKIGDKIAISSSALGTTGMNGIILSTNNNDPVAGTKVFIDNSGNVGIGTGVTTPTQKLDIDGRIRIRQGTPGVNKVLKSDDANGNASWEDVGTLVNASGQGVPTGTIVMWGGTLASIPTGWQLCDGSTSVSGPLRTQLQVQSFPFGQDFAGRARVPDLRERFIVGAGGSGGGNPGVAGSPYTVGQAGGSNEVQLQESEIPGHTHAVNAVNIPSSGAHTHTMTLNQRGGGINGPYGLVSRENNDGGVNYPNSEASGVNSTNSAHTHTVPAHTTNSTGGGDFHENRPPFFALCFIIKHT